MILKWEKAFLEMDLNQSGAVTWNEYWCWVKQNLPKEAELNLDDEHKQEMFDQLESLYK